MADLVIAALTGNSPGTALSSYVAQGGDVDPAFTSNGAGTMVGNSGQTGFYVNNTSNAARFIDDDNAPADVSLLTVGVTVHNLSNISFNQNGVIFDWVDSNNYSQAITYYDGANNNVKLSRWSGGSETDVATVTVTHSAGTARRLEVDFVPSTANAKLYFYDPAGSRTQVGNAGGYTVTGAVGEGRPVGVQGFAFSSQDGNTTGFYVYDFEATYTAPTPSTTYTLTGPANAPVGTASYPFTVDPNNDAFTGTVTPSDGSGGTFSPTSLTWSGTAEAKTFTYTPASAGAKTVGCTNDGGLTDPGGVAVDAYAAASRPIYSVWRRVVGALGYAVEDAAGAEFLPRVTTGIVTHGSFLRKTTYPLPDDFDGVVVWSDDGGNEQYSPVDYS